MNPNKYFNYFLFIVILVLILLNYIYKNPTEKFLDFSNNLYTNDYKINSDNNTLDLNGDGLNDIESIKQIDLNADEESDVSQMVSEFNKFMKNKDKSVDENNKDLNNEIKNTIALEEEQASNILTGEEVFGDDPIDSEVPLKNLKKLTSDSQDFKQMFQKLEDEYLCNSLERRQKLKK